MSKRMYLIQNLLCLKRLATQNTSVSLYSILTYQIKNFRHSHPAIKFSKNSQLPRLLRLKNFLTVPTVYSNPLPLGTQEYSLQTSRCLPERNERETEMKNIYLYPQGPSKHILENRSKTELILIILEISIKQSFFEITQTSDTIIKLSARILLVRQ